MRLVKSDTSLRCMDADKRNSHRKNSETKFHFSSRSIINFSKGREQKEGVSFVVDRAGVKNSHAADAYTKHHGLAIRYTSVLPVLKPTDHAQETKNESQTSQSKVRLARPDSIPGKRHVLRMQLATSKTTSARRYHVEDDPRFSALKPGVISESLREALGIRHNQLPLYIYNMRRLGYPPGHLENARRQQSGILIFTNDGCEVMPNGKVLEEGEVNDEQEEVLFDVNKLIDFPGFNILPPDGTLDECEILDLPTMQADHSKDTMMELLSSAIGKESIDNAAKNLEESCVYKRENSLTIDFDGHADTRATEKAGSYSEEKMSTWLLEMGLSAADGWLVLDSLPDDDDLCERTSTYPNSSFERISSDRSLPSQQSQTSSVDNMLRPSTSVLNECRTPEKTLHQDITKSSQRSTVTLELPSNSDFSESAVSMSGGFERKSSGIYGGSLDVTSGTPVMVDTMLWSKGVPDAWLFSVGMSEPIPYENLPNSTGAFQKLRKVLTAARCKSKRLSY